MSALVGGADCRRNAGILPAVCVRCGAEKSRRDAGATKTYLPTERDGSEFQMWFDHDARRDA